MCDAVSFLRAIRKKWGDAARLTMFTDCRPMIGILSKFANAVMITDAAWHDAFKREAWRFDRFYDFRPHVCRVFSGDIYTQKVRLLSNKDGALMKRWKQYNSWETNKLQDLKKSVVDLNLESAELPSVPYDVDPIGLGQRKIEGDYITINIGAMGSERGLTQTKQWDFSRWQDVVDRLKIVYGVPIYHVGIRWEKKLRGVHHIWGKPLSVVASILAGSLLHLGNENGMIRLRRLVTKKPSVVVFGPTPAGMYGFKNNANLSTGVCRPCFWYTKEWMWECAMEWGTICMKGITVDMVLAAAKGILDGKNHGDSGSR